MKRTFRTIALLMTVMIVILGMNLSVLAADSSVTYEGGAEKFVFLPGSEYTDTDLFDNFKNVMPGDILQEKIVVQNNQKDCDYVKIYMRAQEHDESENSMSTNVASKTDLASMQDFLSQLSMKVWNGSDLIYQAAPDEVDGLKDNVLLGEFAYGEKTELTVELTVPIELENQYMNRVGEVDWVFAVEEINIPEPTPNKPANQPTKTGDSQNIGIWITLMGIALVVITGVKIYKKK